MRNHTSRDCRIPKYLRDLYQYLLQMSSLQQPMDAHGTFMEFVDRYDNLPNQHTHAELHLVMHADLTSKFNDPSICIIDSGIAHSIL